MKSSKDLKLLGFNFTDTPTVHGHVEALTKKVHQRTWSLINLKRAGVKEKDILDIYKSLIRSVLDYGSVSYHSLLTATQEGELETAENLCPAYIWME